MIFGVALVVGITICVVVGITKQAEVDKEYWRGGKRKL